MKKLFTFSLLILLMSPLLAQIGNKGFNFQGYARDLEGTALGDTDITVKFSIYPEGGSEVFAEEHNIRTDAFGVFTAVVGGVNQAGFFGLDWHNQNYWLQTSVRAFGATDFIEISNSQLLSVPYAQAAGNGVPSGTILPFGGTKDRIPVGFVACDGAVYDRNNPIYANLFNAIDYNWGRFNDLFRVPDLRGIFLRGVSEGFNDPDFASRGFLFTSGSDIYGNDNQSGTIPGSYQLGSTARPGAAFTTNTTGRHGHEIFKDPNLLSWFNDRSSAATRIQHKIYDENTGQFVAFVDAPHVDSNARTSSGGPDDHMLNTNLTGYHTEDTGDHSHVIDGGGDAETRPRNAYVWYIIKL